MARSNKNNDAHNINIYIKDELKEQATKIAKQDGRSLSNLISRLLTEYIVSHNLHQK